jgi:hypothetical protein
MSTSPGHFGMNGLSKNSLPALLKMAATANRSDQRLMCRE